MRGEFEVPSRRVADAFGITEANVNTIRSLGSAALGDPELELLLRSEKALTHSAAIERYGIRPMGTTRSPTRPSLNMEAAAAELAATVAVHKASHEYLRGAQALRSMRERIGYSRHPRFLWLIARLHTARCWFFCHSGFGVSALREAALDVPLFNYLHADSGDPTALHELRDCHLAASNASLLRRRPGTARVLLEKAGQISERLNEPAGWEWVRQQATACFQLEEAEMADRF